MVGLRGFEELGGVGGGVWGQQMPEKKKKRQKLRRKGIEVRLLMAASCLRTSQLIISFHCKLF
jgi:hypothetical protein